MKQEWGTPPQKSQTVATRISNRTPEWKLHSSLGLAHSAFSARYGNWQGEIWELIDNEWQLVFSLPMGTHTRAEFDWVDIETEKLRESQRRLDSLYHWHANRTEDIKKLEEQIESLRESKGRRS